MWIKKMQWKLQVHSNFRSWKHTSAGQDIKEKKDNLRKVDEKEGSEKEELKNQKKIKGTEKWELWGKEGKGNQEWWERENEEKEEENKEKGGAGGGEKKINVKTETREQNYYSFMSLYLVTWRPKWIEHNQ